MKTLRIYVMGQAEPLLVSDASDEQIDALKDAMAGQRRTFTYTKGDTDVIVSAAHIFRATITHSGGRS